MNIENSKVKISASGSTKANAHQLTEITLSTHIKTLVKNREGWEKEELLQSNERLYSILHGCYQAGWKMNGFSEQHKAMKKAFSAYCTDHKINFNASTHIMARIVRVVFGDVDRRRISAYGTALKNLIQDCVDPEDFINEVKMAGGIEKIRRKDGNNSKTSREKRVETGRSVLDAAILGSVSSPALTGQLDSLANTEAVILIATPEADGSFAIRRLVQTESVVKTALASIAKAVEEEQKTLQQQADRQTRDEKREQAIKDTVAEAA